MKRIYTYMCLLLLSVCSFAVAGCDDDDDNGVAKDLIEVIVNKPVVRIGQNEEVKVNIVVGNGDYTVRSFNSAIATAAVSGEQIIIKSGSQNGATTVEVMDGEGVTADISVNVGVFELEVNEPQVTLEVGDEKQLIVSMGNFSSNDELSFTVEDETIVSMVNTDVFRPFYTLTGLKSGHTTVTFTDHKGKQAIVQVTVNPISIDVSNLIPRVGVNNKVMITVEKGNGGYTLTAEDETIVDIQQLDDTHFNLVGKKAGVTTILVKDAAEQELNLTVTVVQADKVAYLGSGNYFKVPFEYNGVVDESLKNLNAITFEAVHGAEVNKWAKTVTPSHNVDLVFTRMLLGPMDYTPGGMRNSNERSFKAIRDIPRVQGTRAHMAAQYVLFLSTLQMISDMPSEYMKEQKLLDFIAAVPTTWDDTKVIEGKMGDYVVIARRKGDKWYLGGMCGWGGKDVEIDLSKFLPEGKYLAKIVRDTINSDDIPEDYKIETKKVTSDTKLKLSMRSGGGFAVKFMPYK